MEGMINHTKMLAMPEKIPAKKKASVRSEIDTLKLFCRLMYGKSGFG